MSTTERSDEQVARTEAQQRVLSRRAILRAGLIAAPVLLSVSAVPVWGQGKKGGGTGPGTACPSGTTEGTGKNKGQCIPNSSITSNDFSGSSLTDGGFNQPALTDGGLSSGGLGGN